MEWPSFERFVDELRSLQKDPIAATLRREPTDKTDGFQVESMRKIDWFTALIWRPVVMLEDKIANIFGISLVSLTLYRAAPSMEMGLWLLNWLVSILVVSVSTISFRPLYNQHIFFLIKEIYNDVDAFIDYPRTIEPTISEVLAILPATFRDYIKPFGLAIFSYYLVVSFLHSPYSLYIAMVISLMLLFKRFLVQQACDTWNSYYVPDSSLLQITSKCTNLFTSLQTSTSWDYLLSEAYTPARYFLLYVLTMAWFIRMEKVSVFAYHVIFVPLIIVIFVLNRILTIYQVMYVALIKQFGPTIQFEGLFVWPFVYHGKSKSMLHCLYEDIFHVEAFVYQNVPLPNELKRRVLVYYHKKGIVRIESSIILPWVPPGSPCFMKYWEIWHTHREATWIILYSLFHRLFRAFKRDNSGSLNFHKKKFLDLYLSSNISINTSGK